MIARATGAFLITLIAVGYLFGDFTSGVDFLVALGVSLLVGLGVAFWLERGERRGAPDVFDEKATRRAVRRGVIRTALVAIVWLVLGLFVVGLASTAWQVRGDRREHFQHVSVNGFAAAHAGFRTPPSYAGCCPTAGLRSLQLALTVEPRSADELVTPIPLELELDLRGRLNTDWRATLPKTAVDLAEASAPVGKDALRKQLQALPAPVIATAVAELTAPLPPRRFYDLLAKHGIEYQDFEDAPVYLEPPHRNMSHEGVYLDNRVSWPTPALAQFQTWVKRLRPDDESVLDVLGLPGPSTLRRLATTPAIHGFVLEDASPARLQSFLDDPAVRRLSIGDVSIVLGGTN